MITNDSKITAAKNLVAADLKDEKVILHLPSGTYFGIDEIGSRVWQLVQEPIVVKELCEKLSSEYDVTLEQCTTDVLALLNAMAANSLIVNVQ